MRIMLALSLLLIGSMLRAEVPASIEDLQREKVAVLKENYDVLSKLYKDGKVAIIELHNAYEAYLEGKLELAKTHDDRMQVHRELVKAEEDLITIQEQIWREKEIGRSELLRSKVMLLDRRIALSREEQSGR